MGNHNRIFTIPQAARTFGVSENEITEALRKGDLTQSYIPRRCLTEADVRGWLLRTGRITFEEFAGVASQKEGQ
jgi:hypothetical protein